MGYYSNKKPLVLTGTLAARPTAGTVPLGSTYLDTTSGVVWTCILVGSTPTWWAPAAGRQAVSVAASLTMTGSAAWDTIIADTWVSQGLVGFTASGAVLTYTGPGEFVTVSFVTGALTASSTAVTYGWSLNNATPLDQNTSYVFTAAGQYRTFVCNARFLLATGNTLTIKVRGTGVDYLSTGVGSSIVIG